VQQPGAQGAGKVAEEKVRVLTYLTLSRVRIDGDSLRFSLLSRGVGSVRP